MLAFKLLLAILSISLIVTGVWIIRFVLTKRKNRSKVFPFSSMPKIDTLPEVKAAEMVALNSPEPLPSAQALIAVSSPSDAASSAPNPEAPPASILVTMQPQPQPQSSSSEQPDPNQQ
jgi:hypothetical protein